MLSWQQNTSAMLDIAPGSDPGQAGWGLEQGHSSSLLQELVKGSHPGSSCRTRGRGNGREVFHTSQEPTSGVRALGGATGLCSDYLMAIKSLEKSQLQGFVFL